MAAPMYNFSIPSALKAWIDQVTFPKMSLAPRRFVVTHARGGAYGPGTPRHPYDHQERYLRDFIQGHYAVDDVTFVGTQLVNSRLDPALAARRAGAHRRRRRPRARHLPRVGAVGRETGRRPVRSCQPPPRR